MIDPIEHNQGCTEYLIGLQHRHTPVGIHRHEYRLYCKSCGAHGPGRGNLPDEWELLFMSKDRLDSVKQSMNTKDYAC